MNDLILDLDLGHQDALDQDHKDVVQDHGLVPREMAVLDEAEDVIHAVDHQDPGHVAVRHEDVPDGRLCLIESDMLVIE